MSMSLKQWRAETGTGLGPVAEFCNVQISTVSRWENGEILPDADAIDRLGRFTGGLVTADDMHRTRLEWLRANRPDKFTDDGGRAAEAGEGIPPPVSSPADPNCEAVQ